MIERTIVLVTRDNQGVSLAREVRNIKQELLAITGGYSEVRQRGAWLDGGRVYRDESVRVVTACTPAQDREIVRRLPEWCARLRQLALYSHAVRVQASFVSPRVLSSVS